MDLATLRKVRAGKAHVHVRAHGWTITSDATIEALVRGEVDVLDRTLPGWLGRYVLPGDAVLRYDDGRGIDWATLVASETLDDEGTDAVRRVVPSPTLPEEEEHDEEEEESGEEEEDEEETDEEESSDEWSDEDDEAAAPHQSAKDEDEDEGEEEDEDENGAADAVRGGAHRGAARPSA
jgi:hypothetical protein